MKKIFIIFIIFISPFALASPEATLYLSIKNNNICIYTKDFDSKELNDHMLVYLGEIHDGRSFKSSYSHLYHNIEEPSDEKNCIIIESLNFKENIPYYILLEAYKGEYARRVCVNKKQNKIVLTEVKDVFNCGKEEYDYSGKSWWRIFLSWFGFD